MRILGIESSCDETSAAVVDVDEKNIKILSNVVSSQIKSHQPYGGVVPEVAARRHCDLIFPVIKKALDSVDDVELIAVTRGPGLMTSLLVGITTAEALSQLKGVPAIGVNHLEGHVLSPFIEHSQYPPKQEIFPAIVLTASGGHTQLVLMKAIGEYETLGTTIDDAAGEAFDKVAKMLELGYPGGPEIDKLAKHGNPQAHDFPRPMLQFKDFRFSFSGLKTAVKYAIRDFKGDLNIEAKQDISASFQRAVMDVLIKKTLRAVEKYNAKSVFVAGGVAANTELRTRMENELGSKLLLVDRKYTGDNAAMIALAGYFEFLRQQKNPRPIEADPKLAL